MRPTVLLLALLTIPLVTGVARAHEAVDEGVRLMGLAQFDEALAAFTRAEAAEDLTREDLAILFESRAILFAAMGRTDAMEADLARLAALEPARTLPSAAPPNVTARWAAIVAAAEPVDVLAVATWDVGVVTVRAVSDGDPGGLVRRVRVGARLAGRAYVFSDDRVQLATADGSSVEYFAQVIGPGGAVIASAGSETAPLVSAPPPVAREAAPGDGTATSSRETEVDTPADRGGLSLGAWLAIGGGVAVVAAVVIIAVLLASQTPDTALGGPMAMPPR